MKNTSAASKKRPAPLTLADITLTWKNGTEVFTASPKQITSALEYVWRLLNDGYGDFDLFSDASSANESLRAAEDLILSLAHTAENGCEVESRSYWAIHDLVRDGRVRYEMSRNPPKPETYRVEISTPAEGGAR
jgi:hypothetical protein